MCVFYSVCVCVFHCVCYSTVGSIPGAKQLAGRAIQVAGVGMITLYAMMVRRSQSLQETYDIVVIWSENVS